MSLRQSDRTAEPFNTEKFGEHGKPLLRLVDDAPEIADLTLVPFRCPQLLGGVDVLHLLHVRAHLFDAPFQFCYLVMQLPVLAFKPVYLITAQQGIDAIECSGGGLGGGVLQFHSLCLRLDACEFLPCVSGFADYHFGLLCLLNDAPCLRLPCQQVGDVCLYVLALRDETAVILVRGEVFGN